MVPHWNKLTSTKECSANLNNREFRIVRSLTNFVSSPSILCTYITHSHFHMKAPPPWTLLVPGPSSPTRPPDNSFAIQFWSLFHEQNHLAISNSIDKSTFSYFYIEMFETCYVLKNSWMYIFQITLFQFVFKTAKISLVDTCNQCDMERK